jgi:hypothetical protein
MSPPTGGIPPFPGLENFMGGPPATFPGSYPAGPGNPFYGLNAGQFNPCFRFPRGGGIRGQHQFGFPGPRGPFLPQMMPRQGGPMIFPRGPMGPGALGGRGVGRGGGGGGGGGRGQRGARRGGKPGSYYSGKENGSSDAADADKAVDDEDLSNDVDHFDRGQAEGVESDETSGGGKAVDSECGKDPSKNAFSEQVQLGQ